jgi:hypothetical protein
MSDETENTTNQVRALVDLGFIALWHGQKVQSAGGGLHYFATERDARDFLRLCDAVGGIPALAARRP